ncbi:response regulator [Flavobacterium taihuense]|uniref:Response regulator n=1 Tax=Flavobacterium taihuense TaxID=2857508 RepID=A0ABS6XU38_9FLAO|nr:response regulator [Flavobacterium taihuense]MBW4360194.1 response regulator [Flavobacterium taihuense]
MLLVDDHPMTVDGYVSILSKLESNSFLIDVITAFSCQDAYIKIINAYKNQKYFAIACLDISLPIYEEKNIYSGIDLALLIRKHFPDCKIILLSMHSEVVLVQNAFQKINPEGFVSKNDLTADLFIEVFQSILAGNTFYSTTIKRVQSEIISKELNFDATDCQILDLISRRIKTKNMTNYIDISLSCIEKRKANIKSRLLKDKGNDREIIIQAKKAGLI